MIRLDFSPAGGSTEEVHTLDYSPSAQSTAPRTSIWLPLRPVDRASVDEGVNHFLPTDFAEAARELIATPLHLNDSTVVPVSSTSPFVETGMITAPALGTAMPCVNWGGVALESFKLTLASSIQFKKAAANDETEQVRKAAAEVFAKLQA